MQHYLYLVLDVGSILFPFLFSWDRRIRFADKWPALFWGLAAMALVFLPWDIYFTQQSVWGFNPRYLLGASWWGLPVEEWLFFFCIPYACLFIYEALIYFFPQDRWTSWAPAFFSGLGLMLMILGVWHYQRLYTAVNFIGCGLLITILRGMDFKRAMWSRFLAGYLVSLIPFFIVNGILTGSWIEDQVVWYNNAENLGLRMGTIPVEDSIYMMFKLLIVTVVYEWRLNRW